MKNAIQFVSSHTIAICLGFAALLFACVYLPQLAQENRRIGDQNRAEIARNYQASHAEENRLEEQRQFRELHAHMTEVVRRNLENK